MEPVERVAVNPKLMLGKAVIRGTRIPVELILHKLGEGATTENRLDAYPRLTADGIQTAILFDGFPCPSNPESSGPNG